MKKIKFIGKIMSFIQQFNQEFTKSQTVDQVLKWNDWKKKKKGQEKRKRSGLCLLALYNLIQFSSVQFSRSGMSSSLQPQGLLHARPPCLSPNPGAYSNSCPLSRWCHPTISSSVVPFCSRLQSFPASGSSMSQFLTSGGQSIGVSASASVLPMNIQDWFPLRWTGWISL